MRQVALLRGINVSGANKISMAELRELCAGLGWRDVETYIQSGNVVFGADGNESELEAALEAGIEKQFGLTIPVIVRSAERWRGYMTANPFTKQSETEAKFVHLLLAKETPAEDIVDLLNEVSAAGEQVRLIDDGIWIYYPNGVGRSKITPAKLDRAVGSPVTARNWNTVVKLNEMLG